MKWLEGLIGKKKFKKLSTPMLRLFTILTLLGTISLSIAPVFLGNELQSESEEATKSALKKIELVLQKILDETLKGAKNTQYTTKNYTVDIGNKVSPIKKDISAILVFEEQAFELCGYQEFTANVTKTTDGKPAVKIRSMDRSIPNRPFRGYEKIIPVNQAVEIWPNCRAMFKYENLASTKRIAISYFKGKINASS